MTNTKILRNITYSKEGYGFNQQIKSVFQQFTMPSRTFETLLLLKESVFPSFFCYIKIQIG